MPCVHTRVYFVIKKGKKLKSKLSLRCKRNPEADGRTDEQTDRQNHRQTDGQSECHWPGSARLVPNYNIIILVQ